jgi:hypothetical protein
MSDDDGPYGLEPVTNARLAEIEQAAKHLLDQFYEAPVFADEGKAAMEASMGHQVIRLVAEMRRQRKLMHEAEPYLSVGSEGATPESEARFRTLRRRMQGELQGMRPERTDEARLTEEELDQLERMIEADLQRLPELTRITWPRRLLAEVRQLRLFENFAHYHVARCPGHDPLPCPPACPWLEACP